MKCQGCQSILWMHCAASLRAVGTAAQKCHTGRCTKHRSARYLRVTLEMCCLDRETNGAPHQCWPGPCILLLGSSLLAQKAWSWVRPLARQAATTVSFCSVIRQHSGSGSTASLSLCLSSFPYLAVARREMSGAPGQNGAAGI